MITYSIIKKSQLEGALRLDAEYYQPEYFIDFTKGDWVSVGDCLEKCQYGLSLAMNDEKIGYPIYKMDDIDFGFLFEDAIRYVSVIPKEANNYFIEKNDIFFNRVNSDEFVGRTGIFKEGPKSVFASYLIRLRVKNNFNILPDYLNIFLNSEYGTKQIQKFKRRAVNQANVNAEELKQFKILAAPISFQKEIEKLSNESWKNFELSKKFYAEAENLLLEELGLKDFENKESLFSIVNLSDVKSANRIDAEYFQSKYDKLISKIKNKNIKVLEEVIENVPAKFNSLSQSEKLFKYVELSNINSSVGVIDGFTEVSGKDAPSRAKRVLKDGDVIVSSVEGSLEKVALTEKEQDGYLASTGFFQIRSKEILPEVLLILAKSIVFQMQLEKECAGTILTAVPKEAIKNILVPVLPKTIQQKIAELVKKSHEACKKAKELLEEAKQKVEKLIDK